MHLFSLLLPLSNARKKCTVMCLFYVICITESFILSQSSMKLKIEPFHSKISYPRDIKHMYTTYVYEDLLSNIHTLVSFISNCPKLETIQMSINRWMDKFWYIYTIWYYLSMKRNKISIHSITCAVLSCFSCVRLFAALWTVNLKIIILDERNQAVTWTCWMIHLK